MGLLCFAEAFNLDLKKRGCDVLSNPGSSAPVLSEIFGPADFPSLFIDILRSILLDIAQFKFNIGIKFFYCFQNFCKAFPLDAACRKLSDFIQCPVLSTDLSLRMPLILTAKFGCSTSSGDRFRIFDAICRKGSLGSNLKQPKHKIYINNIVIFKMWH